MHADFARLDDNQLLLEERKLYDEWWRHSNKTAVTSAFGTARGIMTAGLTAPISGLAVVWHTKNAFTAAEHHRLCMEEIGRREHLSPLGRGIWGMMWTSVSAATIGTACFFLPFSEFIDCAADAAGEVIDVIAEAGEHLVPHGAEVIAEEGASAVVETGGDHVADSTANNFTEVGAAASIENEVETFIQDATNSALTSLHHALGAVPDELLKILGVDEVVAFLEEYATSAITAIGELLMETAPTIAIGAVDTLCLEAALKGTDSTVGGGSSDLHFGGLLSATLL